MDERQQHWQGVYLAKPDAERIENAVFRVVTLLG